MSYGVNRAWSDQFIPAIRQVVGPLLLVESSFEVDTEQAADLVVMKARDMTIACRVRRQGYADQYPWDFTIRASVPGGYKTELQKIVDGWGDWMLYGHEGDDFTLSRWFVIDLSMLRAAMIRCPNRCHPQRLPNKDGTTFVAYDLTTLPANVVVASSHAIQTRQTCEA